MGTERDLEMERDSEMGSYRDRERRKGKTRRRRHRLLALTSLT